MQSQGLRYCTYFYANVIWDLPSQSTTSPWGWAAQNPPEETHRVWGKKGKKILLRLEKYHKSAPGEVPQMKTGHLRSLSQLRPPYSRYSSCRADVTGLQPTLSHILSFPMDILLSLINKTHFYLYMNELLYIIRQFLWAALKYRHISVTAAHRWAVNSTKVHDEESQCLTKCPAIQLLRGLQHVLNLQHFIFWILVKIFWGRQSVGCLIELSVIKCKGKSSNVCLIVAVFGE